MELVLFPTRWSLIIRAIVNIALGAVALAWPGLTLLVLVFFFAINLLLTGIFMLFEPAFDSRNNHAIITVLLGVVATVAGIYLLARPQIATEVVVLLIAFWAIIFGMFDLAVGIAGQKDKLSGSWLLIITGVLAFVFGIYMLFNPITAVLTLILVIGLYAIVVGTFLLVVGAFFYPKLKAGRRKR